jgi:hypothetical protein
MDAIADYTTPSFGDREIESHFFEALSYYGEISK